MTGYFYKTFLIHINNKKMKVIIWVLMFIAFNVKAQKSDLGVRIGTLFEEWNQPNVPGVAIAVVQDGNILYQNCFGLANLEKNISIDSATKFWIASVTKQFTALGIYLLESQNKIDLKKSIRVYLPQLPALYEQITVEHLVHHTSGVRDGFVLTALSKKPEDEYTNANVLKYLVKQKELNFKPGTAFEYNNSGYVLLALIIENISKRTYRDFMETYVFLPLGMTQTFVSSKYIADDKSAEGYNSKDFSNKPGSFEKGHFKGNTYGSTGIMTTLRDMTRWEIYIQGKNTITLLKQARQQLLKTGRLNSGDNIAYSGGLEKLAYNGSVVYEHFGSDEGFKANALYFPSHNLSIIGLSNNTNNYALSDKLYAIANVITGKNSSNPRPASDEKGLLWEQSYFAANPFPAYRHVKFYHGYLKVSETPEGRETRYFSSSSAFQTLDPVPLTSLKVTKEEVVIVDHFYHQGKKLRFINQTGKYNDLSILSGRYFSDELETSYDVIVKKDELFFEFVPGVELKLHRVSDHDFIFDYYGANFIEFTKDGFLLSREGIHNLKFKKI
jgi:CubicO group peptidase (beta-lactamase class C family)